MNLNHSPQRCDAMTSPFLLQISPEPDQFPGFDIRNSQLVVIHVSRRMHSRKHADRDHEDANQLVGFGTIRTRTGSLLDMFNETELGMLWHPCLFIHKPLRCNAKNCLALKKI
jgi:hypothetical protein